MSTVIHFGLPKTGTTTLQKDIFPSLQGWGLLTRPQTQRDFFMNFLQYADESLWEKDRPPVPSMLAARGNLIVSDEALSGKLLGWGATNRTRNIRRLAQLFPGARALIFLRDQASLIRSMYSTFLLMPYGEPREISEFLWPPKQGRNRREGINRLGSGQGELYFNTNQFYLHLDSLLFSPLISAVSEGFPGPEVILYEEMADNPAAVSEKLSKLFGEKVSLEGIAPRNRSEDNIKKYNLRESHSKTKWGRYSQRYLHSRRAEKPPPTLEAVTSEIGNYFHADNLRLRKMLPSVDFSCRAGAYPYQ